MKKEVIRNKIADWSKEITAAYPGLRVRYEYSDRYNTYLVSLYPDALKDLEAFSKDAMAFEDTMAELFDDSAPLFCDNDELFTLTPQAEMVMSFPTDPTQTWAIKINDNPFAFSNEYNLAA